jgi:putative SOS response-associated peptidase YedK
MPAIFFDEEHIAAWLDPSLSNTESVVRLLDQLQPSPNGVLKLRRVSTLVNSPLNDVAELLHEAG